jgi:hypothetical protein
MPDLNIWNEILSPWFYCKNHDLWRVRFLFDFFSGGQREREFDGGSHVQALEVMIPPWSFDRSSPRADFT